MPDTDPLKASYLRDYLSPVDSSRPKAFNTFIIECVKPAPSRGRVTLQSVDPTAPPIVDLGLYQADADLTRVAMGIEWLREMMDHPILRKYAAAEVLPGPACQSVDQLKDYLRSYSSFGHHISGTVKMEGIRRGNYASPGTSPLIPIACLVASMNRRAGKGSRNQHAVPTSRDQSSAR